MTLLFQIEEKKIQKIYSFFKWTKTDKKENGNINDNFFFLN